MTKKSHARLMRDSWKRANLLKLAELAEYTPDEMRELEALMDKMGTSEEKKPSKEKFL